MGVCVTFLVLRGTLFYQTSTNLFSQLALSVALTFSATNIKAGNETTQETGGENEEH